MRVTQKNNIQAVWKRTGRLSAVLALWMLGCVGATAATLNPGDILRVSFTHDVVSTLDLDLLTITLPFTQSAVTPVVNPTSATTLKLYDEGNLLGTYSQSTALNSRFNATWSTAGSPYTFGSPVTADLSSIIDGTSNAWIDITISSGQIDVDLGNVSAFLTMGDSQSASSFSGSGTSTAVTGFSVVPLPAAAWLFGSALLGLGIVKRRKA